MKDIDLPESVIEAGVHVYVDVLRRDIAFTSEGFVTEMFTAMARALVDHDKMMAMFDNCVVSNVTHVDMSPEELKRRFPGYQEH